VEGKLLEEHNKNVIMGLQSKLASTSMTFKDVLEVRTQVRVICRLYITDHPHRRFLRAEHEGLEVEDRTVHVHGVVSGEPTSFQYVNTN